MVSWQRIVSKSFDDVILTLFLHSLAIESLETVGSNRVDVAMEYALTHPPSSPGTLERRRAMREQRRQRQEQLAAAIAAQEASNESSSSAANAQQEQEGEASAANGDAPNNPVSDSNAQGEESESKRKALSEEEIKAKKEEEFEEKDALRAKEYLDTVKEIISTVCLNIIEAGNTAEKYEQEMESLGKMDDGSGGGDCDTEDVTVVVSSFLVDLSMRYPADLTKMSTALIRRCDKTHIYS